MRRRLFTLTAFLSLLLCAATVVLWVRSHFAEDDVAVNIRASPRAQGPETVLTAEALSLDGGLSIAFEDQSWPWSVDSDWHAFGTRAAWLHRAVRPHSKWSGSGWRRWLSFKRNSTGEGGSLFVSYVILAGALIAIPALHVAIRAIRLFKRTDRHRLCPTCSYNLTGNTSGVCPECGNAVVGKTGTTT